MHVVHIVEAFGSGTLQVVCALVRDADARGWRTTVYHGLRDETPRNFKDDFPERTRFVPLKTGRGVNGVLDVYDSVVLSNAIRKDEEVVLHGHSSKGGMIARLAGYLAAKPVIYTPHGFSFLDEKGVNRQKVTYWAEKLLGLFPATVCCCSDSESQAARDVGENIAFIPNFINAAEIRKLISPTPSADKQSDVVCAGRISHQKNMPLFLSVARTLPHYRFIWVGGPESLAPQNLPENVRVTGWVAREEALNYIAQSKLYLSTSRFEGMPIAMLEAKALGLPIVTTQVVGSRDVVKDHINGRFADTAADLSAAIAAILEDAKTHALYGQNARLSIETEHDAQTILNRWANLYQQQLVSAMVYAQ